MSDEYDQLVETEFASSNVDREGLYGTDVGKIIVHIHNTLKNKICTLVKRRPNRIISHRLRILMYHSANKMLFVSWMRIPNASAW